MPTEAELLVQSILDDENRQAMGGVSIRPAAPSDNVLAALERDAVSRFNLRVSSRKRTPAQNAAAGGAKGSHHLTGSALDVSGDPAKMRAFAEHAAATYGPDLAELFYDPWGGLKHGQRIKAIGGHGDHVHVAFTGGNRRPSVDANSPQSLVQAILADEEAALTRPQTPSATPPSTPGAPSSGGAAPAMTPIAPGVGRARRTPAGPPAPAAGSRYRTGVYLSPFTGEAVRPRKGMERVGRVAQQFLLGGTEEDEATNAYYQRAEADPKLAPPVAPRTPEEKAQAKTVKAASEQAYKKVVGDYRTRIERLGQTIGKEHQKAQEEFLRTGSPQAKARLEKLTKQWQQAASEAEQLTSHRLSSISVPKGQSYASAAAPSFAAANQERFRQLHKRETAALINALALVGGEAVGAAAAPVVRAVGGKLLQKAGQTAGGKVVTGLAEQGLNATTRATRKVVNQPVINPIVRGTAGVAKATAKALKPDEAAIQNAIAGAIQQPAAYVASTDPKDVRADRLLSEALTGAAAGWFITGGFKLTGEGYRFVRDGIRRGLNAPDLLRQAVDNSSYVVKQQGANTPLTRQAPEAATAQALNERTAAVRQREAEFREGQYVGVGKPATGQRFTPPAPKPVEALPPIAPKALAAVEPAAPEAPSTITPKTRNRPVFDLDAELAKTRAAIEARKAPVATEVPAEPPATTPEPVAPKPQGPTFAERLAELQKRAAELDAETQTRLDVGKKATAKYEARTWAPEGEERFRFRDFDTQPRLEIGDGKPLSAEETNDLLEMGRTALPENSRWHDADAFQRFYEENGMERGDRVSHLLDTDEGRAAVESFFARFDELEEAAAAKDVQTQLKSSGSTPRQILARAREQGQRTPEGHRRLPMLDETDPDALGTQSHFTKADLDALYNHLNTRGRAGKTYRLAGSDYDLKSLIYDAKTLPNDAAEVVTRAKKPKPVTIIKQDTPGWGLDRVKELAAKDKFDLLTESGFVHETGGAHTRHAHRMSDGKIALRDRFFDEPVSHREHILRHEMLHGVEDPFLADPETNALFKEGAFGPTPSPAEAIVGSVVNYLEDPEWLRENYPKAYKFVQSRVLREFPHLKQFTAEGPKPTLSQKTLAAVDAELAKTSAELRKRARPLPGKGKGGRSGATLAPEDLALYGKHTALLLAKGTLKAADFAEHWVRELGEEVRPHLDTIWQAAKAYHQSKRALGEWTHDPQEGIVKPRRKPVSAPKAETAPVAAETPPAPPSEAPATPKADTATVKPKRGTMTRPEAIAHERTQPQTTGVANQKQSREVAEGVLLREPEKGRGIGRRESFEKGKAEAATKTTEDLVRLAEEIGRGERDFNQGDVSLLVQGKKALVADLNKVRGELDRAIKAGSDAPFVAGRQKAYQEAQERLQKFVDDVQKGKTGWSNIGRELQQGLDINYGNFEEVLLEASRRAGREISKESREGKALAAISDQLEKVQAKLRELESLPVREEAAKKARQRPRSSRSITEIRASRESNAKDLVRLLKESKPVVVAHLGSGGGIESIDVSALRERAPEIADKLGALAKDIWEEGVVGLKGIVDGVRAVIGSEADSGVTDDDIAREYLLARNLGQRTVDQAAKDKAAATRQAKRFVELSDRLANGETLTVPEVREHRELLKAHQDLEDAVALRRREADLQARKAKLEAGPFVGPPEPPVEEAPAVRALLDEIEALRQKHRDALKAAEKERLAPIKAEEAETRRLESAAKALQARIEDAQRRLEKVKAGHDVGPRKPNAERPAEVHAIQDEIDRLRAEQRKAIAEQERQRTEPLRAGARLQRQIEETQRKIDKAAAGLFVGPKEGRGEVSPELKLLRDELAELRKQQAKEVREAESERLRPEREAKALARQLKEKTEALEAAKRETVEERAARRRQQHEEWIARKDERHEDLKALDKELEAVRKDQAVADREARLDTEIAKERERLAKGDFSRNPAKKQDLTDSIREKQANLRKMQAERRLRGIVADLEAQLEQGFGPKMGPEKPKAEVSEEVEALRARRGVLQREVKRRLNEMATPLPLRIAEKAWNLSRNLQTTLDDSAGRQLWKLGFSDPDIVVKGYVMTAKASLSDEGAERFTQRLMNDRPNSKLYLGRLEFNEPSEYVPEHILAKWKKGNPFAIAQRRYNLRLNLARADLFDRLVAQQRFINKLARKSEDLDKATLDRIGMTANTLTGKGLTKTGWEEFARKAASFAYAPGYAASELQSVIASPLWQGMKTGDNVEWGGQRSGLVLQYAKMLAGASVFYAVYSETAKLSGETDPVLDFREGSTTWGQVRVPGTKLWINPLGGASGWLRLATQIKSGKKIGVNGKERKLTLKDAVTDLLWNKNHPNIGMAAALHDRKDFKGDDYPPKDKQGNVEWWRIPADLYGPITPRNFAISLKENGWSDKEIIALFAEWNGLGAMDLTDAQSGSK